MNAMDRINYQSRSSKSIQVLIIIPAASNNLLKMKSKNKSRNALNRGKKYTQLEPVQKVQLINSIKARTPVMFIKVTSLVEGKKLDQAKQVLLDIADDCLFIQERDDKIQRWLEITCSYLFVLHRILHPFKSAQSSRASRRTRKMLENFVVLRYNKFSGEFEPDDQRSLTTPAIMQYVSKINMILFGIQNGENNHSLYIMCTTYWVPLCLTLLMLAITLLYVITDCQAMQENLDLACEVPLTIIGVGFLIPLIMIFLKKIEAKDDTYFTKKLGEQIQKINQDCKRRHKDIVFMVPNRSEINIRVGMHATESEIAQEEIQMGEEEALDQIISLNREISRISA